MITTSPRIFSADDATRRQWAIVRFYLGMAQTLGASAGLTLLFLTCINSWSVGAMVVTSLVLVRGRS